MTAIKFFIYSIRIVVMAGDGGVSKFINLMIEYEANQQHNSSICEIEELKSKLLTPLCIIPCGSTNMIANSIYGTNDLVTPLMYLFYGKLMHKKRGLLL